MADGKSTSKTPAGSKTTASGDVMNPGSRQSIANDAHDRGQSQGSKIQNDQTPKGNR